jgi:phage terminase large subunit-like protein
MTEYIFDEKAADEACQFFERFLTHVDGELGTGADGRPQAFRLADWQAEKIIRPMFGWKRKDNGFRKFRTCYIEIPRKNGKSTLSAGIALQIFFGDKEPGGHVFSAAADRDQASIVFETAKRMIQNSKALSSRCEIYRRSIVSKVTGGYYKVLSADAGTKHGLNAHGIIFDELHAQPNRELWDVLTTSTGARRQPLTIAITTAGYDEESICYQVRDYACKVRDGLIIDPTFLPVIYGADRDDDFTQEEIWKKANPNYGISITREYLEQEALKAKESASYQNTFKRLHLNIWTQQSVLWLDMADWDACASPVDLEALKGRPCYAGLDLSATADITALSLIFPPQSENEPYQFAWWYWIPEEGAAKKERLDRVPYSQWPVNLTTGNVVDYEAIKGAIRKIGYDYSLMEIAYDPWNATQVAVDLQSEGYRMIQFRQGFVSYNEPTKEFEKLLKGRRMIHGGNPVTRWMASNVSVKTDPAANIKPVKPEHASNKRIDGITAAIMALGLACRQPESVLDVTVI